MGPNLAGVWLRKAGTLPGYGYSPGFADADWVWDAGASGRLPGKPAGGGSRGSVMGYRQSNPAVRQAIIGYLAGLAG